MARYTYNAGLVTQTIDTLYSACDTLDSTNVDIKKGIDMIYNARGAENINIDFSPITGYQSSVIEYIETMATEIQKKAQEIEEYQDAPWYKKLFATIGMGALKLVEGLASFVEQIGDGIVSIVGFIGGIFSSDFKDCMGEFVKKDWVGDTTAKWYEEGWLQSVNKYSVMSHESTAANILKGVGVAAGYVILSVATAGAGTAVSLGVSAVAAGVGGIGSGTQSGLQAGMTFNQAFGQGVKQGATAAATTLIVGGIANKLGNLAKGVNSADEVLASAQKAVTSAGDDLATALANTTDDTVLAAQKAVTSAGDELANALLNTSDEVLTSAQKAVTSAGDELANALLNTSDEAITAASKALEGADEAFTAALSNSSDDAILAALKSGTADDLATALANTTDDTVLAAQKALVGASDELTTAIANTTDDAVAAASKAVTAADDALASALSNTTDDAVAAASKALNSATDDLANAALNSSDDAVKGAQQALNKATNKLNKITNPSGAQKVVNKVTGIVDKGIEAISKNPVGAAVGKGAAAIGTTGVNAIAAGAGSVTGGMATAPVTDMPIKEMNAALENPSLGQQLYTESQSALEQNIPSSATEQQAQQNLQNLQDQGYNPGSGSPEASQTPVDVTPAPTKAPSTSGPTGTTGPTGTKPSVTAPEITMPEYTTQPPQQTTAPTPAVTTPNPYTPDDQVISTLNPVNPTPTSGPTGPNNPGVSNLTDSSTITDGTKDIASSDVLDTFGNVSGSLSDLSSSKTNIPTSSSPILSSDGGSSTSKLVPLGAGLGAASIAGIGAKAYLDKREKSNEEDEDEIETEEWASQEDVEIDYGLETDSEEADYLSPTDELAFTE